MKYEYTSEHTDAFFEHSAGETNWLNEMGKAGWQMTHISPRTAKERIYYFKRLKQTSDDKDKEIERLKQLIESLYIGGVSSALCGHGLTRERAIVLAREGWAEYEKNNNL